MDKDATMATATPVYYCKVCGYGYADSETAEECSNYCSTHASCSLKITAKAIRRPAELE